MCIQFESGTVGIFLICYMLGKIHKMHKMKQIFQNLCLFKIRHEPKCQHFYDRLFFQQGTEFNSKIKPNQTNSDAVFFYCLYSADFDCVFLCV